MATPMQRKLRYISKRNKLAQLVVLAQYHVNVIYSLGGRHTHTNVNIPTSRTKAISRNQVLPVLCKYKYSNNIIMPCIQYKHKLTLTEIAIAIFHSCESGGDQINN